MHNQRGFGRPLVTSSLNVVLAALKLMKDEVASYYITQKWVETYASLVNDEYFRMISYDCSFPYEDEHDNNDGRSEIDIDIEHNTVSVKFFNPDGKEMLPLEYIVDRNCVEYCDSNRRVWFIETQEKIKALDPNYKTEDD